MNPVKAKKNLLETQVMYTNCLKECLIYSRN